MVTATTTPTPVPTAGLDCGDLVHDPCFVTVTKGNAAPKTFSGLPKAVKAAPNGATITVQGRCVGPVAIKSRSNLIIQGVAPSGNDGDCPSGGLGPADLTSTVTSAVDEVIKVTKSSGIVIRFLNIVGGPSAGVELKDASANTVFCNCIARNDEGVELHGEQSSTVEENLVKQNVTHGIRLNKGKKAAQSNEVEANVVIANGEDGILLEEKATDNEINNNLADGNADDGIELNTAHKNRVTNNTVTTNVDDGIVLVGANRNEIDMNTIAGNGDGQVDTAECVSGSQNTGSNVPPACQ